MQISNQYSPSFQAQIMPGRAFSCVKRYAKRHGKADELDKALDNLSKQNTKVLLNLGINTSKEGFPMVSFTRHTPKMNSEKDRAKNLYKRYKPSVYISDKKMNPVSYAYNQLINLAKSAPEGQMYCDVVIENRARLTDVVLK